MITELLHAHSVRNFHQENCFRDHESPEVLAGLLGKQGRGWCDAASLTPAPSGERREVGFLGLEGSAGRVV
jgi:hypothetical protein